MVKNWFMMSVRLSSNTCTRKVWRAREKRKKLLEAIAESNFSFMFLYRFVNSTRRPRKT